MFTCENCLQPFKAQSSLLRHISHKESCKDHYGQERLHDVRKASRLISKRKWMKSHYSKAKSKNRKDKESIKEPKPRLPRYCDSDRKRTEAGKLFTDFYKNIYYEALIEIEEEKLDGLVAYDAVYEKAYDNAVDLTMDSDDYMKTFDTNVSFNSSLEEGMKEGVDIDLEIEKAFEISFDRMFKSEINQLMDKWISARNFDIYDKCYKQGERTAFSNYFEDFESIHLVPLKSKARESAGIDRNTEYIERLQEINYKGKLGVLVEEFSRSSDFSRIVYKTVYDMIYRKVIMWIRLNKVITD